MATIKGSCFSGFLHILDLTCEVILTKVTNIHNISKLIKHNQS